MLLKILWRATHDFRLGAPGITTDIASLSGDGVSDPAERYPWGSDHPIQASYGYGMARRHGPPCEVLSEQRPSTQLDYPPIAAGVV